MGGSSCGSEFRSARGPPEMISYGRSDANGKILIKRVGEHLLPSA
jgi:hypothetical protein